MSDYNFDLVTPIVFMCLIVVLIIFGAWYLVDYLWINHDIISKVQIHPTIKLEIHNNVVDTLYVYKRP